MRKNRIFDDCKVSEGNEGVECWLRIVLIVFVIFTFFGMGIQSRNFKRKLRIKG